jgi:Serine dehydrogenase proteinase
LADQGQLKTRPSGTNEFIEQQLDTRIQAISTRFKADAISFNGPLIDGTDDLLRTAVENLRKQSKSEKLAFVLTTRGGYIEIVHRIVDVLRYYYQLVDFVVPNYAYSAGTVLVMSGDAIHMDYYSRLGPIDPQVETQSGHTVSALGYLQRYENLIKKASDPAQQISAAEVQILLEFDQGELYQYEQARDLSISLLKEWLVKYKFKNWKQTETRKIAVTQKMKTDRAEEIAKELTNAEKWHSHGYGISKTVLERDLKLLVDDFGADSEMSSDIRGYHDLLSDYMDKMGMSGVIHTIGHFEPFLRGSQEE